MTPKQIKTQENTEVKYGNGPALITLKNGDTRPARPTGRPPKHFRRKTQEVNPA